MVHVLSIYLAFKKSLNTLKEKYGDRIQFISIIFDNPKIVERFLKKTSIYFEHITDANEEINQLEISAFPTNLILEKNGIVQFLMGALQVKKIWSLFWIIYYNNFT